MFLIKRDEHLHELMDAPNADRELLSNTYKSFRRINHLLAFWKTIYVNEIKPLLKQDSINSIADIGCGDGYVLHKIGLWAEKDGFKCKLTGFEPDSRARDAIDFPNSIRFIQSYIQESDEVFDFIISNHVLHHLSTKETSNFLDETSKKARIKVIHNDILRSVLALLSFPIIGIWFARNTFVLTDGLRSIRRSFTRKELSEILHHNWKFKRGYPFRLVLINESPSS